MKIIAYDLQFPEGPVWLGDGSLLVVEIRRKTLTRIWLDGRPTERIMLGGGPNGAAMGTDGRCYVCNNGGIDYVQDCDGTWHSRGQAHDYQGGSIQAVELDTGVVSVLADHAHDQLLRGPNDLVIDQHNGIYFTDTGKVRSRDLDFGAVYYIAPGERSATELAFPLHRPNGIALSPDGSHLYVTETETTRVFSWAIESPGKLRAMSGAEASPGHGGKQITIHPIFARYDGIAMQQDGRLCIATLVQGGITVLCPQTGKQEFVSVPGDPHLTNLCFGGPQMKSLFVTQSRLGRLIQLDWLNTGAQLLTQ